MTNLTRPATFRETDPLTTILADLTCPRCGYQEPGSTPPPVADGSLRIFCEGCGAFITILLTAGQARALGAEPSPTAEL